MRPETKQALTDEVTLDPDRLAAACIAGRRKYDATIFRGTAAGYSPSEALSTAIEHAIRTYVAFGYKASPEKAAA